MSTVNCEACNELREYAPAFVQNGVTDVIATSLKNNTGLNPSLTALHENCEDLNDANDCYIGRMVNELPAYDVCDWKQFMSKLLPNQYEILKAIIAGDCGQWDRIESLCAGQDSLLQLIRGAAPKAHTGEWLPAFYNNVRVNWPDGQTFTGAAVNTKIRPSLRADIISGVGCTTGKRLGRWQLGMEWIDDSYWPGTPYQTYLNEIPRDTVLGVIPRSAVPASDISDSRWKGLCRGISRTQWGLLNGDTIYIFRAAGYVNINGVWLNENLQQYGENTLCIIHAGYVGDSRSGNSASLSAGDVTSYDA